MRIAETAGARARWILFVLALLACAPPPARAADEARAAKLHAEADTAFAHQDWARAAKGYEALAKLEPNALPVWFRLGASRASLEQWDRAADAYRRADALSGFPWVPRYNMACAFARAGRRDSALVSLGVLMDRGYRQPDALLADTDFESLRADPEFVALVERARANATPCAHVPESRQFDFWLGEWDVFDRTRNLARAGASHIDLILGQCVVLENWSGVFGGHGKSFNVWNSQAKCWQQTWVDDSGSVTYFQQSSVGKDGTIAFLTTAKAPNGGDVLRRLSFTPLGPDEVRQFSESSTDGGTTWSVGYDFLYRRHR